MTRGIYCIEIRKPRFRNQNTCQTFSFPLQEPIPEQAKANFRVSWVQDKFLFLLKLKIGASFVNEIGFMFSPERLNVLLSRARNALIMIGNSDTFTKARRGKELWQNLFEFLKEQGHIYDGFPVKCEQHPDRIALLTTENQFDTECPHGGCSKPW